jgi:putative permease
LRNVVRYSVLVLLTLAGFVILWEFREAIILFLLSLALGAVFRPLVNWMEARGLPRVPAILLSYLIVLSFLIGLISLAGPPLGRELQHATDNFAVHYTRLRQNWTEGTSFQQTIAAQLPPLEDLFRAITGEQGEALARNVIGVATNVFSFLSGAVIVIALSMYWSADRVYFERLWLSFLPANRRTRARETWREIEVEVGGYIRSELIQAVLTGLLLALAYSLLGLRYPALLALVGALAWLIPWVGAILAVIPAFLVGTSGGLGLAIAASLLALLVMVMMELLVEKRMFQRQRFSSVLLVLVAIAMIDVLGLLGVIIAPPLAAALQIAGSRMLLKPSPATMKKPIERLARLRFRLEQLRESTAEIEEPPAHLVNLINRLEKMVRQAEEAV